MPDVEKQLKLKTGVLTRTLKELKSYAKEEDQEKQRLSKLQEDGADESRLKQQKQVIEETSMMIPHCRTRLEKGFAALEKFLNENDSELDKESEQYQSAQEALEQSREELGK
eukprot:gb/GECH01011769.1/.p1 GENE.gb/GECH01011769.1/~~gb/GECH01011769.1/.p1  ORF type:complete len:112 (+),score=42.60 gb/GECH01011769.1/:1-336(+)